MSFQDPRPVWLRLELVHAGSSLTHLGEIHSPSPRPAQWPCAGVRSSPGRTTYAVPAAGARCSRRPRREFVEMPNRGHALTIDSGWRDVADTALTFVGRFVK
jgi:hypothetical protein